MSEAQTHVKGELLVRNPTAAVLNHLLSRMIFDQSEYPPARMAELVMEQLAKEPADMQIGPGLRAITGEKATVPTVRLKWEFWA